MGGQKGPKWKREAVPDHKVHPARVAPERPDLIPPE